MTCCYLASNERNFGQVDVKVLRRLMTWVLAITRVSPTDCTTCCCWHRPSSWTCSFLSTSWLRSLHYHWPCSFQLSVTLQQTFWNSATLAYNLQCFDTVGWQVRKSIRPLKLSNKVLVWLSDWSELQIVCIWCCWQGDRNGIDNGKTAFGQSIMFHTGRHERIWLI